MSVWVYGIIILYIWSCRSSITGRYRPTSIRLDHWLLSLISDPSQLPNLCPSPRRDLPAEMVSLTGLVTATLISSPVSSERSLSISILAGSLTAGPFLCFFFDALTSSVMVTIIMKVNSFSIYILPSYTIMNTHTKILLCS